MNVCTFKDTSASSSVRVFVVCSCGALRKQTEQEVKWAVLILTEHRKYIRQHKSEY